MSAHRARPVLKTVQLQWRLKEITPQTGKRIEIPVAQKQEGPKSPTHIVSGIKRTETGGVKLTYSVPLAVANGLEQEQEQNAGARQLFAAPACCSCS